MPVVKSLRLWKDADRRLDSLKVRIWPRPALAGPTKITIDRIPAGGSHHLDQVEIDLDPGFLANLEEGLAGELHVSVEEGIDLLGGSGRVRVEGETIRLV